MKSYLLNVVVLIRKKQISDSFYGFCAHWILWGYWNFMNSDFRIFIPCFFLRCSIWNIFFRIILPCNPRQTHIHRGFLASARFQNPIESANCFLEWHGSDFRVFIFIYLSIFLQFLFFLQFIWRRGDVYFQGCQICFFFFSLGPPSFQSFLYFRVFIFRGF